MVDQTGEKIMNKILTWLSAASLSLFASFNTLAADQFDEFKTIKGSEVRFSLPADYFNAMLTISGPNGFFARSFSKSGSAAIDLIGAGATADGYYTYELTAATRDTVIANNRRITLSEDAKKPVRNVGVNTFGSFYAEGGIVVFTAE